ARPATGRWPFLASGAAWLMVPGRWRTVAGTAMALLLVGWIGLYQLGVPVWVPWAEQPDPARADKTKAAADAEAQRKAAEAEQQRLAAIKEEEQRQAKAADLEAKLKAAEAEQQRLKEEVQRQSKAAADAEAKRKAAEAEQQRLKEEQQRQAQAAADAEAKRKAAEAEQQRLAAVKAEEERKAKTEAEAAARRKAEEAEQQRLAAIKAAALRAFPDDPMRQNYDIQEVSSIRGELLSGGFQTNSIDVSNPAPVVRNCAESLSENIRRDYKVFGA